MYCLVSKGLFYLFPGKCQWTVWRSDIFLSPPSSVYLVVWVGNVVHLIGQILSLMSDKD